MNILFTDATVLPMTAAAGEPQTFTGSLGISGNRIEFVSASAADAEAFRAAHPDARTIDCRGKLLMPGLINTHCHAAMTLQRSYADDIALMEWLNDYIWPFEARQTPDDVALGMTLGIVEMLLGGVTSFVDMYYFEDRGVEVVRRTGIRAVLGCNYFDTNVEEVFPQMERALELAAGCDRIRIAAAPHAPYTVSPENMVRGKEFCRQRGMLFMTHAAETVDEARIVRERFGKSPVQYLDGLGVLDDRTIAAHCVHLDEADIATLAARQVVVSHNPQSNMKISSGVAPIERLREAGALVTVATDGPCSNNDLDLFEELRTAAFLQKSATGNPLALPACEALKLATVNGARAMGYAAGELGVLKAGALADVIVVDLQKPHLQPIHDPVSNLVYCAKASDVETVVVDGELLVEERRVRGIDLPKLFADVAEAVKRIKR
ncbi:MAG: amidohydrolase [Alistipes sp.]|nr:amidohydrolase [Alistipes sp.]